MEQKQKILHQFKSQSRLPNFAIPIRYDLHLKTHLSACTFSGIVQITLTILHDTKFIVLNALELDVHGVSYSNSNTQKYKPSDVILDEEDEILVLVFDDMLRVGEGILEIEFSAPLNSHLKGFYKCTYVDGGVKKNMAVTQFEAVDARRCFPCWDEPALKASFKITLDVPKELMALSNMPVLEEKVNGDIKTVYFEESPYMSTYVVAFVIGLFDYIEETTAEGIKVRVYCPLGKREEGRYSLNLAIKVLDYFANNLLTDYSPFSNLSPLERYFSMSYPLPKLDMVAVPEFCGGAMENNGLIIYRENLMLCDALHSSAENKQVLGICVAHEVAHHWFGNLVTMAWWSDLWLNEGFATWVSYMAIDTLFPEWKMWTQFLQQTASGLVIDALEESHPIEMEIHPARSIDDKFDAISYKKGSTIIRMLQIYLGDDKFQKALSEYIERYAWKNAKTDDLWAVISEESGTQINSMMNTWTKQMGYPVISVKSRDNTVEFEQSHFLLSGQHSDSQWIIPITLSVGSYNKQKNFLLETKFHEVDISKDFAGANTTTTTETIPNLEDGNFWIKVNISQSGFYRVKYDDKLASQLRKAIENNVLSETDKFGILDDAYALCQAGQQSLSSVLSLIDVYRKELDCIVTSRLIHVCNAIVNIATEAIPDLVFELKQFFINVLQFPATKLGWEPIPDEDHSSAILRGRLYRALASFDDDKTHEEAMQCFQAYMRDRKTTLLSADTKMAAYLAVIRKATVSNRYGFESILQLYREADAAEDREDILRILSACPDPDLLVEALDFLVSDEVREQDIVYGLAGISFQGRHRAWKWFKENWDPIFNKYGANFLLTNFVRDLITPFCSNEEADEIEAFFATHPHEKVAMDLKQSLEQVRIKARWVEFIKQDHSLPDLINKLAAKG
ncbi:aminopeptidase M1-like isoform X2 [Benincasa hispida]|uniref:aminopeptidase M1-like isoform X2 n=1 Tax=Benincasa hispida TaxID=102211 RepID=UPI00190083EF|nr:aminopeptidase M1-like isoform X2 [Benincasa hispida]